MDRTVRLVDVHRSFGSVHAVDGVSLDIEDGQFVSLLGPSGCGKTTLLRMIAGLEKVDSGSVLIGGQDVTRVPPYRRPANMVFQRYALFPHKTVAENVAYGLRIQKVPKPEAARRVSAMLEMVQLPDYGPRRIDQLSGGQAQRVALARALVNEPAVLLLDEPLAALDLKLRQAMHGELREIQRRVGSTFVYVTHDQEEALVMSDRVVLMNDGVVIQDGTPLEVYTHPRSLFAARFVGEANVIGGRWGSRSDSSTSVETSFGVVEVTDVPAGLTGDPWICVRPERVQVFSGDASIPQPLANRIEGTVEDVQFLGPTLRYRVVVGQERMQATVPLDHGKTPLAPGTSVTLAWKPQDGVCVASDGQTP